MKGRKNLSSVNWLLLLHDTNKVTSNYIELCEVWERNTQSFEYGKGQMKWFLSRQRDSVSNERTHAHTLTQIFIWFYRVNNIQQQIIFQHYLDENSNTFEHWIEIYATNQIIRRKRSESTDKWVAYETVIVTGHQTAKTILYQCLKRNLFIYSRWITQRKLMHRISYPTKTVAIQQTWPIMFIVQRLNEWPTYLWQMFMFHS